MRNRESAFNALERIAVDISMSEADDKINEVLGEGGIGQITKELNEKEQVAETRRQDQYIEAMVEDFARLLVELKDKLEGYDTIISDDSSGRLPAIVLRRIINKKRKAANLPEVNTFFVASGRHNFRAIRNKMLDFFNKKKDGIGKALLVSEYISSGGSIEQLVKVMEEVGLDFDLSVISIEEEPDHYAGKDFVKHLIYGGVNSGGLYFYGHGGTGVIKDEYAGKSARSIHPIKNPKVFQQKINSTRENMNFLADELYSLVETK